jgi:phytoene/squalene synthetase
MIDIFHEVSEKCSRAVTERYSTSFSTAIRLLHKDLRTPIRNIYGFVRFADEIVDTFHQHDKATLLEQFKKETYDAISRKISLNPILHSFQLTVNEYDIDLKLVNAFFNSMELDLHKKNYSEKEYEEYIYGSAEVVGLMCLSVFCEGKKELCEKLKDSARALGAAFQKVNFLRDMEADYNGLSRIYFPDCDVKNFTATDKAKIEANIHDDFKEAYNGILQLPAKARFGVYVAYRYYFSLFKKIKKTKATKVISRRIRIPNYYKALIVLRAGVKNSLRMI